MLNVSCSSTAKIQLEGLDLTFFSSQFSVARTFWRQVLQMFPAAWKKWYIQTTFVGLLFFFSSSTLLINYNPAAPAAFDIEMSVPRSCKHTYSIKMPSIYIGMWRTCASSGDWSKRCTDFRSCFREIRILVILTSWWQTRDVEIG